METRTKTSGCWWCNFDPYPNAGIPCVFPLFVLGLSPRHVFPPNAGGIGPLGFCWGREGAQKKPKYGLNRAYLGSLPPPLPPPPAPWKWFGGRASNRLKANRPFHKLGFDEESTAGPKFPDTRGHRATPETFAVCYPVTSPPKGLVRPIQTLWLRHG